MTTSFCFTLFNCYRTLWIFSNVWLLSLYKLKCPVTGPCEFLVMYDDSSGASSEAGLQDPVNF